MEGKSDNPYDQGGKDEGYSTSSEAETGHQTVDFSPPVHGGGALAAAGEYDLASEQGFRRFLAEATYYELLQVKSEASPTELRTQYLRRMRQLLKDDSDERLLGEWQFQELIVTLNIAHQVLQDPVTRASYNRALSGQHDDDGRGGNTSMDIIELIRMFKLLGPRTQDLLQKVRDENPDCSQREIAGILVENSYLTEEELESVVLACYLLAVGKLKLTQLELVMDEIKETKAPLWVSLVAKGWVKMRDLI